MKTISSPFDKFAITKLPHHSLIAEWLALIWQKLQSSELLTQRGDFFEAEFLLDMAQVLPQHAAALAEKEAMVMATLEQGHHRHINHYNSVVNQLINERANNVPEVKRWFVRATHGEIDVHTRMVTNAYNDYLKSTTDSFAIWKSYTQAEYTKLVEGMLKHI